MVKKSPFLVFNWDHVLQATCGKIGGKHRILLLIFIVNLDSFVMGPLTKYNNKDCHIQCMTHYQIFAQGALTH